MRVIATALSLSAFLFATGVQASDGAHVEPLTEFANSTLTEWVADPMVIAAIKAQNEKNAGLSEAEIIDLDKKWRAEVDAPLKPMVDAILKSNVSAFLADKREHSNGFVTEIFLMDAKGLNVAQSDVTSDYWQGDEAKWKKTYPMGPKTVFVDDVEMDESTQTLQSQVSMSITDPATGEVIGAVTVGVNVDAL